MKTKPAVRVGRLPMRVFFMAILFIMSLPVTLAIAADPMDNMPMAGTKETKVPQASQPSQGTGWGAPQSLGMMGPMMGRGGMMGRGMGGMMGCPGMMGHGSMGNMQSGQGGMSGMQMDQGKTAK